MQVLNLKSSFDPYTGSTKLALKRSFNFPGGEIGVQIAEDRVHEKVMLTTQVKSANDIMELFMVADAVKRLGKAQNGTTPRLSVCLPYMPYGRQDRVVEAGEAFSLAVFAKMLKDAGFETVITYDPHSEVQQALFEGIDFHAVSNVAFIRHVLEIVPDVRMVTPDAGAAKKIHTLVKELGVTKQPVQALKYRVSGGNIASVKISETDLEGRDLLIVDDVCDGGATFIALVAELKKANAGRVYLAVSHGIFSKGLDVLRDASIEHVFTTDSFASHETDDFLTEIKLCDIGI